MRVVAGAAANHNNHVRLGDQFPEGGLSILRRLTDGIDESNIAIRVSSDEYRQRFA